MKIYQCTIVSQNSCYLHTLLVIAQDEASAHKQLCEHQKMTVEYTRPLKEIKIDLTTPKVIDYVGWGHNDSDYGYDD